MNSRETALMVVAPAGPNLHFSNLSKKKGHPSFIF